METWKKFVSFCTVGGIASLVELGIFNIVFLLDNPFLISKIAGIFFALSFNFIVNRRFTFLDHNGKKKKQIPKFIIVYILTISVNLAASTIMNNILPGGDLYANIAAASGIIVSIPISFFGSLKWTFRNNGHCE